MLKSSSKFRGLLEARFKCDCNTHTIEVSQWQDGEWDDTDVYLEFWYRGRNWTRTPDKLRSIWRILRGRSVHQEEIVLTPREAHKLGRALLSAEDPKNTLVKKWSSHTHTTTTDSEAKYRTGGEAAE